MCTGILVRAQNGAIVRGRTMEWGSSDIYSRIFAIARQKEMFGTLPDGSNGCTWKGKYGFVAIDAFNQFFASDGINEKGLTCGLFYHPGTAKYESYDQSKAATSMAASDLGTYMLSNFATVAEVKEGVSALHLVGIPLPGTNVDVPCHYLVADPSGKALVIEFLNGKMTLFDNPVGVITNSPAFDWHMTNLRNYLHFTAEGNLIGKYAGVELAPIGHGAGLLGVPGDFTPPSRFVRAAAFVSTARPTADAADAVLETARIMDSFNLPIEPAKSPQERQLQKGLLNSTTWTTISDLSSLKFYYHTQFDRRLRCVDLKKLDFSPGKEYVPKPLDKIRKQAIEDVTFP